MSCERELQAYRFEGGHFNYIDTGISLLSLIKGATLSTWFIYEGGVDDESRPLFGGIDGPARRQFFIGKQCGTDNFLFEGHHFGCGVVVTPLPQAWDGAWHHLAATWNGDHWCFYLDGEAFFTRQRYAISATVHDTHIGIGTEDARRGNAWVGFISDARVYARPLTVAEIQRQVSRFQEVREDDREKVNDETLVFAARERLLDVAMF